jgi:hypothetical protein
VDDRDAAVGEQLRVVGVRVVTPGVVVVEYAVTQAGVWLEKADRVQELDRGLAMLF